MNKGINNIESNISAERLIGIHEGEFEGPLLITIGGIHGNEPAGIFAIEELLEMIRLEPQKNSRFQFSGNLVGLRGNLQALKNQERYLDGDLNRRFTNEKVQQILRVDKSELKDEDFEMREIIDAVHYYVGYYKPKKLVILDLHTTSSEGGIFSITSEEAASEKIALGMYAPVVRGILKGINGSTIHYFNTKNIGVDTSTVVFEGGQHENPMAVKYTISGIINCLRSIGCVQPVDVEARHDNMLKDRCVGFPKMTKLIYKHGIKPEDHFKMKSGYVSFQEVSKGEVLATDIQGDVHCPYDGRILMPLYQKQGQEGFFLVKELL